MPLSAFALFAMDVVLQNPTADVFEIVIIRSKEDEVIKIDSLFRFAFFRVVTSR